MTFIDFKKIKKWLYEVPTYEQPFWEKVDEVVDAGLDKAFGNPTVVKGMEKIDTVIKTVDEKITKIVKKAKEDTDEKSSD